MQTLFTVTNASKSYGDVPALKDATLALYPGEVHALVGENGAGKSTLIKIMAGVVSSDSAEFTRYDASVTISTPQDALNHGMRFIHQELSFVPALSAAENIFLGKPYPRFAGIFVGWNTLAQRAREVLAAIGIDHIDPRRSMARLSVGDQMLVRIAAAFADDEALLGNTASTSKIYVMDEPTAALTGAEVDMLFRVIGRLRDRGDAVLYVSHRLDEIFQITDTTTVMRNGEIVHTGPTVELTHDDMILLMTGRDLENVYPPRTNAVSEAEARLEVRDLSSRVLRGVSFSVAPGEIVGVTGLRASGQTDLLRVLAGAARMTNGAILLDGNPLRGGATGRWEAGIAYVPRERRSEGLVMGHSVRGNTVMPHLRHLARGNVFVNQGAERDMSQVYAAQTRLKATSVEQTVRELSGGNQQKVVFGRALARRPRVLLLDEPTRGVDVGAKFDIYSLIRDISAEGTAILMASTDLPELIGMCDRVLVMQEGAIIAETETSDLTERELLSLCYGRNKSKMKGDV